MHVESNEELLRKSLLWMGALVGACALFVGTSSVVGWLVAKSAVGGPEVQESTADGPKGTVMPNVPATVPRTTARRVPQAL
jgi:hypothetical protein